MKRLWSYLNPMRKIESFPQAALQLVIGFTAGFLVVHALGWREDVSFISGTMGAQGPLLTACFGMLYLLFYFGFVIVAPIFAIAALIFKPTRACLEHFIFSRSRRR